MGDDGGVMPTSTSTTVMDNVLIRYFIKKHSWRGRYNRAFCLMNNGQLNTLNPASLGVTNYWQYTDIQSAVPSPKNAEEFTVSGKKSGGTKIEKSTFSTPHRAYLLADLNQALAATPGCALNKERLQLFAAKKVKRTSERRDVLLCVRPWGVLQMNPISNATIATYYFHHIQKITPIGDVAGGFVIHYGKEADRRLYFFVCDQRQQLMDAITRAADSYAGVKVPLADSPASKEQLVKVMRNAEEESVFNTLAEFNVLKHTPARHVDPAPRILTLSDKWLVERNPGSYGVITMRPLAGVDYLVRPADDAQALIVHFADGTKSHYTCTSREALLTTMLDCIRAAQGSRCDAVVLAAPLNRGLRMTPPGVAIDQDMEAQIVKALATCNPTEPGKGAYIKMLVDTFNANVPYSGPRFSETSRQHKLIVQALTNIINVAKKPHATVLHAIRRILAVRSAFEAFTDQIAIRDKLINLIILALKSPNDLIAYAGLEVMNALMVPGFDLTTDNQHTSDASNKASLIAHDNLIDTLIATFASHVKRGTSPLVVLGCIENLSTILCSPYGDTTGSSQFNSVLEKVAGIGREFFKLFHQSNCLSVVRGAGYIMKAIIEEGGEIQNLVQKMQLSALVEGATLRHLHAAIYTKSATQGQLLFKNLSKQLVALWVSGCPAAEEMLGRVLPPALCFYLKSEEEAPEDPEEAEAVARASSRAAVVDTKQHGIRAAISLIESWRKPKFPQRRAAELRERHINAAAANENWDMLFYQVHQDHFRADLVWNNHTREELRECLENEIRVFKQEQELASDGKYISWNHSEFIVPYECLRREVNVNGYYLRLLLNPQPGQKAPMLRNPAEFFDMLFHRTLLEKDGDMQALCIQAMTIVYKYYNKGIGPFRDVAHLIALLRQCTDRTTRDRLLQLFYVLLGREDNAKLFVDCGGIQLLVDLMTLIHYSIDHVITPAESNLLTAGVTKTEGEWYYSIVIPAIVNEDGTETPAKKERYGPKNMYEMADLFKSGVITPGTLCWAQGMEDWKALGEVPQLRWHLMATGNALLTNVDLASLLLDMLTKLVQLYPIHDADGGIIRPLPRPKRQLSAPLLLPHIAQMFLTFEATLVDKAAYLLYILMEDNAAAIPKAYLTGVFYFALVYNGSNILQIVKLLKRLHMCQHFKEEDNADISDFSSRSILYPLLPSAMIHILERKTPEEFAAVFLGNQDTPEAIWNHEMRALLIDRISAHLGNFPQRLQANPKALYQYVPIPPIVYKQVESELFCSHYYLRNFCDLGRFPMWPVENEVEFLQALLVLWSKEKEGPEAPSMSVEEACRTLKLKPNYTDGELRRAYFRMAKEFHPDKNPEGKDIFQKITEAYNLLTTKPDTSKGKNHQNLIVKAQSILYVRFREELSPFKYAGYPLLLTALQAAFNAEDLDMLNVCTELCHRTLQSTNLNVEELRRQEGLELLAKVLTHVYNKTMPDTRPTDVIAQILTNVLLTFATAATFDQCREVMAALPNVCKDIVNSLSLRYLPQAVEAALLCINGMALEEQLATRLMQLKVLYRLVPFLFRYDYTLDQEDADVAAIQSKISEGTVADPKRTQQKSQNLQAVRALVSFYRLGIDPENEIPDGRRACVRALLSPAICRMMGENSPEVVLKALNSNTETPVLLWNTACRNELIKFIEAQLNKTTSAADIDDDDEGDIYEAARFRFATLERELQIGYIFVRLFIEQPQAQRTIPDPMGFCAALLEYFRANVRRLTEAYVSPNKLKEVRRRVAEAERRMTPDQIAEANANPKSERVKLARMEMSLERIRMAAQAFRDVLRSCPKTETLVTKVEDLQAVFLLLAVSADPDTQVAALEAIAVLTKHAENLEAIASAHVVSLFGPVLCSARSTVVESALATFSSMLGHNQVVADSLDYGVLLYLMRVFSTPTERGAEITPRTGACTAMAKMCSDPVYGSRLLIAAHRFLPQAIMGSIRQDPEQAVHMFDAIHENPELIWTPGTRAQLKATLDQMCQELYTAQCKNPATKWDLPDDYQLVYTELADEPMLGGVYVNVFLKQPGWALRNPKNFLEALLTKYVEVYSAYGRADLANADELMEIILNATNILLSTTPQLCDHAAKTGHVSKIVSLMTNDQMQRQPSAVGLTSILCTSELCCETLGTLNGAVRGIISTGIADPKHSLARAIDTLDKCFSRNVCRVEACLIHQLTRCKGVEKILEILDGKYDRSLGGDAAEIKARAVSALTHAADDATHGMAVQQVLDSSPVWSNYRGQRHDLFLPGQQVAGLLTAGTGTGPGGTMGLLTNHAHNAAMSDAPPDLF